MGLPAGLEGVPRNVPLIDGARRVASEEDAPLWRVTALEEEGLTIDLILVAVERLGLLQLGDVPRDDLLVLYTWRESAREKEASVSRGRPQAVTRTDERSTERSPERSQERSKRRGGHGGACQVGWEQSRT